MWRARLRRDGPDQRSIRLPAQESGYVQLVLFAAVMHRSLPPMLVEPLRRGTLGIFGHRLRPRLGPRRRRRRTTGKPFGRRLRRPGAAPRRRRRFLLAVVAATEAYRGQPLQ